jgi:metal-responsive CopG/Arc/MetJ family transcriptional regulator
MTKSPKHHPISIRLSKDVMVDMDKWISEQRVPPSRSKFIEIAVKEFLRK